MPEPDSLDQHEIEDETNKEVQNISNESDSCSCTSNLNENESIEEVESNIRKIPVSIKDDMDLSINNIPLWGEDVECNRCKKKCDKNIMFILKKYPNKYICFYCSYYVDNKELGDWENKLPKNTPKQCRRCNTSKSMCRFETKKRRGGKNIQRKKNCIHCSLKNKLRYIKQITSKRKITKKSIYNDF